MSEIPYPEIPHPNLNSGYRPDTVCHTCRGDHRIVVSRASVTGEVGESSSGSLTCPQCDGSGRLPGFVAPL
ncbi:MAG TPA: hypothetical protein VIL00_12860 [Pseudonocardiaceae bacterium]